MGHTARVTLVGKLQSVDSKVDQRIILKLTLCKKLMRM
jgi:hypothetical protein